MKNTDKVIDYIISNAGRLTPEKIAALSSVVGALKGEINNNTVTEPNMVKDEVSNEELMQHRPVDMSDITGIEYDNGKTVKTKIYST